MNVEQMLRRKFLKAVAAVSVLPFFFRKTAMAAGYSVDNTQVFTSGVASGDPTSESVILWTRAKIEESSDAKIYWTISKNKDLTNPVDHGEHTVTSETDFTIKVRASKLSPGTFYYYQFVSGEEQSIIGRTKTLPVGDVESVKLAVVSCSNYPAGHFNVYNDIAKDDDIDVIIHLGDYLYEYGASGYATENAEKIRRVPSPPHPIVTLDDYRMRHAQYKSDPDLQRLHAKFPFITVWDDHEFADGAWKNGAGNHNKDQGEWKNRRSAAMKAYFEWMPIQASITKPSIVRQFSFGNLASLIMLDTRIEGRDKAPSLEELTKKTNLDRSMLGLEQEAWLKKTLQQSDHQTWQVIGQQILVAEFLMPDLRDIVDYEKPSQITTLSSKEVFLKKVEHSQFELPFLLDSWDGYPEARIRFIETLKNCSTNPIVLTGDLHTAMCNELHDITTNQPVAVELVTPAVTSPGLDDYYPSKIDGDVSSAFVKKNPHISFVEGTHKGWIRVTLTKECCDAEWVFVDNILLRDYTSYVGHNIRVVAGERRIKTTAI